MLLALLWVVTVGGGLAVLWSYEVTPGGAAEPPARWPDTSRIVAAADRPTLVVLLHPRCPCSLATLEELDRLVARVDDRVAVHVLFAVPPDLGDGAIDTDLWRRAAAIRGVSMVRDDDGIEAARFHALTSGQALLYDTDGRLLFSGGITGSRGHAGDNPGLRAMIALIAHDEASTDRTPVFGCALQGPPAAGTAHDAGTTHAVL